MFGHKSSLVDSDTLRAATDLVRPFRAVSTDTSISASGIRMSFVDALFRPGRLSKIEGVIVLRVLVFVINLEWITMACSHGIDNPMRWVWLAVDVHRVSGVTVALVGDLPSCHATFGAFVTVDCVSEPRRAR